MYIVLYLWGMAASPITPLLGRYPPQTPGMILIVSVIEVGVDLISPWEIGLKDE
jgi:hypothetical protein